MPNSPWMAEFAKVSLAAAPGCPNCKNRLSDLPLDTLSAGDTVQCLFCGESIRIPQQVLDRLLEQREAQRREQALLRPTLWQRIKRLFGWKS